MKRAKGVPRDYPQAAVWYRLAGEQGNADAQYNLARFYVRGYLGAGPAGIDYGDAFYWYQLAAEQGLPIAEAALGNMYFLSQGVAPGQKNYTLAIYWCTKAAQQGNVSAESSLGRFYSTSYELGYGTPPDYAKSLYWYRSAAEQGDGEAQAELSEMYFSGQRVPQDYAESYFWWLAGKSGEQKAAEDLEGLDPGYRKDEKIQEFEDEREHDLLSHLTPEELSQVRERARKWLEEHPPRVE